MALPDVLKYDDSAAIATLLDSGLNSLANNARALSTAITPNDELYCDLELVVQWDTVAPSAGAKVAEVYCLVSVDGTNYPAGDSSNDPQKTNLVAVFETRVPSISATDRLVVTGIPVPARSFKVLLKNVSGQTYETSGNTLKYKRYKLQLAE